MPIQPLPWAPWLLLTASESLLHGSLISRLPFNTEYRLLSLSPWKCPLEGPYKGCGRGWLVAQHCLLSCCSHSIVGFQSVMSELEAHGGGEKQERDERAQKEPKGQRPPTHGARSEIGASERKEGTGVRGTEGKGNLLRSTSLQRGQEEQWQATPFPPVAKALSS